MTIREPWRPFHVRVTIGVEMVTFSFLRAFQSDPFFVHVLLASIQPLRLDVKVVLETKSKT